MSLPAARGTKIFSTHFVNAVADHLVAAGINLGLAYALAENHRAHVDAAIAHARRSDRPEALVVAVGDFIIARHAGSKDE